MIKIDNVDEWVSMQHVHGVKGDDNYHVIDGLVNVRTGEIIEPSDVDNWQEFIKDYYRRVMQ
jgi:hypothetical protein